MSHCAVLALENGEFFQGIAIGALGSSEGEVVFNTSMTGYQEILTDPSYAKQIITLTHPHIGNTGVNSEDEESSEYGLRVSLFETCRYSQVAGAKKKPCKPI